jgi:AAA domain
VAGEGGAEWCLWRPVRGRASPVAEGMAHRQDEEHSGWSFRSLLACYAGVRVQAPISGAGSELAAIQAELAEHMAALVVLDPLYLAAAGASGANLYDMGAVLQAIQGVCQVAGCALLVVTHWSKTGDGRGADRISGAGPAAWARVICSVAVHYRGSEPDGPVPWCWGSK